MNNKDKPLLVYTAVCVSLFLGFCSMSRVGAGEVGIVTMFGKTRDTLLHPGIHFLNPLSSVHKLSLRVLTTHNESQAASSDLQNVDTVITLNYSLDGTRAKDLYKQIGFDRDNIENSIIQPAINETSKAVVAKFNAEDLINERAKVSKEIEILLSSKLKSYFIRVRSLNITNFKFSGTFNSAIDAKVIAQQNILTEKNNLSKIKIEAEQRVVSAKADADAMKVKRMEITPELIQLKKLENEQLAIQKWDGKLPQYTGKDLPFIMQK